MRFIERHHYAYRRASQQFLAKFGKEYSGQYQSSNPTEVDFWVSSYDEAFEYTKLIELQMQFEKEAAELYGEYLDAEYPCLPVRI